MPNLPPKTHVADGQCYACGKGVKIMLNKNGNAYYFCGWVNTDTGNQCNDHHRFGHDLSQKFQREYLEARAAAKPKDKPNEDPAPEVRDDAEQDGGDAPDLGAIEHAGADTGGGGWGLGDW